MFKCIKLYTYIGALQSTQFCIARLQDSSPEEPKSTKILHLDPTGEAHNAPANPLAGGEGQ